MWAYDKIDQDIPLPPPPQTEQLCYYRLQPQFSFIVSSTTLFYNGVERCLCDNKAQLTKSYFPERRPVSICYCTNADCAYINKNNNHIISCTFRATLICVYEMRENVRNCFKSHDWTCVSPSFTSVHSYTKAIMTRRPY